MYEEITAQARTAVTELLEQAKLKPGALLVIGCSSSEMVGSRIGKGSSEEAAKAAFEGHTGKMVGIRRISNDPYQSTTELLDIHDVANFEKKVPLEWINDYRTGMKPEFLSYARPLIQAELTPVFIDGLPRHIYLK